jgi:hypothetical protein
VQAANAAPSSLHSKVSREPGVESSEPAKAMLGERLGLGSDGLPVIVVSGGARSGGSSTVHE